MDELEDNFFQQLANSCSETKLAFEQHIGLSQARRQLLTLLSQAGELSHAALQQQLEFDGATVTRLVKQFEAEGIVTRRLDPQNNRYTLVSLTPSGQQTVAGLRQTHRLFQSRVLAGITEQEQEIVISVFERLRANIRVVQDEDAQRQTTDPQSKDRDSS